MMRILACAFAMVAIFASPFTARGGGDDELTRITGKSKIALEKWNSLVDKAIKQSQKLEKSDPGEAEALVRDMMRSVKNTEELSDGQRSDLVTRLQRRLTIVSNAVRRDTIETRQKVEAERPKRPVYTPPAGGGSSGFAKDFIGSAKTAQDGNRAAVQQRETNVGRIYAGMEKTPPYPKGDSSIAFPADWATRVASRKTGPVLTPKEAALLKTLNSVMTVNYDGDKFRAVLDHLRDKTGLTIIVDEGSLEDAKVDYDDPVTFKGAKVNVRTALKKILGDKSLTYVIKEGCIQVMTPKKASEMMVIRSYPVGDLVQPDPQLLMMYGPFFKNQMMLQNAQQLINLIQSTIEPTYWQANGGPATITFFLPTQSIVVRASAEMHYQLGSPGIFGR